MFSWYTLLKFIHVLAVIVWLGGVTTVVVLNARLTAETDPAAGRLLWKQSSAVGQTLIGPGAGIALLAGIAMAGVTGWSFPFWMLWGLGTVVASLALGAVFIRKAAVAYAGLVQRDPLEAELLASARRRLTMLNVVNLVVLVLAVAAMVFKPTF